MAATAQQRIDAGEVEYVWRPQAGPQKALIDCPVGDIFFGGARGGGKTDGLLGKFAILGETYGADFNAIIFRRELPAADDIIERSHALLSRATGLGWKYNAARYSWRSPAGARLRFRPLMTVSDAEKYQGQNISHAGVEEAGQYPDSRPIDRLNGVLRSAAGLKTQLVLTGNPGGPGQQWIRARYIDPHPAGFKILRRKLPNGAEHGYVFIPSRLQNNRILMRQDPDYINRLYLVGSAELVRAWLDGDWDAVEGAFFDCWSHPKHVIAPLTPPEHWLRIRAFDWGSAAPFSVGWYAVSDGMALDDGRRYPRGALIKYREWYGMQPDQPNVGLKMTAEAVADGITRREASDPRIRQDTEQRVNVAVADPSIFSQDGGPSIAERMGRCGVYWAAADNRRVGRLGHVGGWDQMRSRLIGEDDKAMLLFASNCTHSIRTIPMLPHDDSRTEDVDTDAEDHPADETRYACMSRPWVAKAPASKTQIEESLTRVTMNQLWKDRRQGQRTDRRMS